MTLHPRGGRFLVAWALSAVAFAPPASAQVSGPAKTRRTAPARSARAAEVARSAGAAALTGSIRAPLPAAEIAAARSLGNGILRFAPEPPVALIFVNDSAVSGTAIALPPGDYHVRFEAPGRLSATLDVRIERAGQVVPIRATLPVARRSAENVLTVTEMRAPATVRASGFLSVRSEPAGAAVRLDGDSIGVTPLDRFRAQTSEYYLRLSMRGYRDAEQMIRVSAGQVTVLHIPLRSQSP